jgi:hypothetical protein
MLVSPSEPCASTAESGIEVPGKLASTKTVEGRLSGRVAGVCEMVSLACAISSGVGVGSEAGFMKKEEKRKVGSSFSAGFGAK